MRSHHFWGRGPSAALLIFAEYGPEIHGAGRSAKAHALDQKALPALAFTGDGRARGRATMEAGRPGAESPFRISLQAGTIGSCEMNPEVLSVQLAQHVLRSNVQEMWNSVSIFCEKEPGGSLVVRVMVFNPDWESTLQIAELRSWPRDGSNLTPLGCNLDHVGS